MNNDSKKKAGILRNNAFQTIIASLLCIVIGLLIGYVVLLIINPKGAAGAITAILKNYFYYPSQKAMMKYMGTTLVKASALLMCSLSVLFAYKVGLFNIGAAGQYLMGTMGSISVGLWLGWSGCPSWLAWICAFIVGITLGALWGAIPGLFKAFLNINEVITCIMTNWIAANLVTWWFDAHDIFKNAAEGGKVGYTIPLKNVDVLTPKLGMDILFPGSQANGGFWIACLIAVLMWVVMTKTTFGYELRACGLNRHAAKYAGINDKKNIVLSMVIAGALASAGGCLYFLSGNTEFYWSTYMSLPTDGFNGIPVALLAANHPIGVIFTGIFMSMLNVAGIQLKYLTAYNEYIADIIIATIVYLSAFAMFFKMLLNGRRKKKETAEGGTK